MLTKSMLAGLLVFTGALASAATLTPTTPNSVVLTVLSLDVNSTVLGYDLRGTTGGTVDALGTVYITDGVPLGFPSPANPNVNLLIIDAALDQYGLLSFDTPVVGGVGLLEHATFSPFTVISNPALSAFVDSPPLVFEWSLTGTSAGTPIGNLTTTVSTWQLFDATSSVPEPASYALVGFGVLGIILIRKNRSQKRLA